MTLVLSSGRQFQELLATGTAHSTVTNDCNNKSQTMETDGQNLLSELPLTKLICQQISKASVSTHD